MELAGHLQVADLQLVDGAGGDVAAVIFAQITPIEELAHRLLDAIAGMTASYCRAQVEAGARAIQVFDTWAGLLAPAEFAAFEAPALARIFAAVRDLDVPVIYYVNGGAALIGEVAKLDIDVAGIDWRTPLDVARAHLPDHMAVQGNLDPISLLGPADSVREKARDVLRRAGTAPGHVFNLGHGIHKDTPIENVEVLVETVREGMSG